MTLGCKDSISKKIIALFAKLVKLFIHDHHWVCCFVKRHYVEEIFKQLIFRHSKYIMRSGIKVTLFERYLWTKKFKKIIFYNGYRASFLGTIFRGSLHSIYVRTQNFIKKDQDDTITQVTKSCSHIILKRWLFVGCMNYANQKYPR